MDERVENGDEPVLMTQGEVERKLRLGERAFSRLRRMGVSLPPRVQIGGRYFYRWSDVEVWLEGQTTDQ